MSVLQVGYCGLDRRSYQWQSLSNLDIMTYCKGYVAWDYVSLFIQASRLVPLVIDGLTA